MVSNLKMKRIQLGLKQKDVAAKAGITAQYLRNLENGKAKNPSVVLMKKIATILNSSVEELFFNEDLI